MLSKQTVSFFLGATFIAGCVSAVGCGGTMDPTTQESPREAADGTSEETGQLLERPDEPKYDAANDGPSALGVTSTFTSSQGRGGFGPIRDLKFLDGSYPDLLGYERIPVNLNQGAGGRAIHLAFNRTVGYGRGPSPDNCDGLSAQGQYLTSFFADDFRAVVAGTVKGACKMPFTPIWQPFDFLGTVRWKQPDLNDGAGGRYIFAWQYKDPMGGAPIAEVGVLTGNSSTISCPAGWTRIDQDLNQGAGGDYVYFCYRR